MNVEREEWKRQQKKDCVKNNNKPNGVSWFALGFSLATLIAVLFK